MDSPTPNKIDRPPLTAAELKAAYPKLCKCLDELDALHPELIGSGLGEEPFIAWTDRYNLIIDGIYGHGSAGCERFCISDLSAMDRVTLPSDAEHDAMLIQRAYASGVASMRQRIMSLLGDHAAQLEALGEK